jgi:hypothetical protein
MKLWIGRMLRGLINRASIEDDRKNRLGLAMPVEVNASSASQTPHARFGMLQVMNGKVLEVCTYKFNPNGPDWTTTYWILNEEQPLADQLAVVMTMKGLEK